MRKTEKNKMAKAKPLYTLVGPFAEEYRRNSPDNKWPSFLVVKEGINAQHPGFIESKHRGTVEKYMSRKRKEEAEFGASAYASKVVKLGKSTPPKPEPGDTHEIYTMRVRLHGVRDLVSACTDSIRQGIPDYHGWTKLVDMEMRLSKRYDELLQKQTDKALNKNPAATLESLLKLEIDVRGTK